MNGKDCLWKGLERFVCEQKKLIFLNKSTAILLTIVPKIKTSFFGSQSKHKEEDNILRAFVHYITSAAQPR